MQHKKTLFELSSILAFVFLYSCNSAPANKSTGHKFCIPDTLLKNITYDTLLSRTLNSELSVSGKIAFNEDHVSKIFPPVSGHISDVKVSLGDYVEKGKVIAVIRSSDMANYFNDFKSSQSELAIAKKDLEVINNMRSSGVSSEKDYLVAQNEYNKALAQYNKSNEILKIYGNSSSMLDSTGSEYLIKSPINGFIVEKNLTVGMDIRPDANENLFTISDLKELWATANVYETDIAKIRIGTVAEVTTLSYPHKKFLGKVDRISNIIDPETKLMNVKIHLDNPDFILKPGMFAHIDINFPEGEKILSIRTNTIIFDENKSFVLLVHGQCDVAIKEVKILSSFRDVSFVESESLRDGDLTIARSGLFIYTAIRNL
jgi:cobalt-zinc-cadmium efflux system membrane fusion protein